MAKTLSLTTGKVKYTAGKVFDTKNGQRVNVVITLKNGEEIKIWSDPGDAVLTKLTRGQEIQLIQNSNGYWQIVQDHGLGDSNDGEEDKPISQTGTSRITIEDKAKLMAECFKFAQMYCGELFQHPDDLRQVAIALFLEEVR